MERGLDSNHIMITEFTNNHKLDAKDIEEAIFKLHDKIEHLQAQIYNLQNQNCEYGYIFKRMSLAADLRIPGTRLHKDITKQNSNYLISKLLDEDTTKRIELNKVVKIGV